MKTEAAILVQTGAPLQLVELEIPVLKPGQALVEILYSGVCGTQVLECRGHKGEDRFLPHCLGHEGTGIVRETGPGVTKVKAGDKVMLSWIKGSGADVPGSVYSWDGKKVNSGALATFNRFSVTSENRLTVLPAEIPMREAALLGCAAATGLGTVINTLGARPGQSIAVFGTGGVGLCAIMGAHLSGCAPIIAVDIRKNKLEAARKLGATHLIDASACDPLKEIAALVKGGLDLAVESSGSPAVIPQALACVRSQGGAAAGLPSILQPLRLLQDLLHRERHRSRQLRIAPDGTFSVNEPAFKEAVTALTRDIMTLQAEGSYERAKDLFTRLGVVRPEVQKVLDRLTDVPVDIEPVFTTAAGLTE